MSYWNANSDRDWESWVHQYDEPKSGQQQRSTPPDPLPHCNRTRVELEANPAEALIYTLPLSIQHQKFGSRFVFWFRDQRDRAAFGRMFEALGYEVEEM